MTTTISPAYPRLRLRPDKEQLLQHRHPWIFSGAVDRVAGLPHGSFVHLIDNSNKVVATGSYSNRGAIAFRVFAWHETAIDSTWLRHQIEAAHGRRELLGMAAPAQLRSTLGYRIVHGEADSLPGITVDRYADVLVVQLSTAGADSLRETVLTVMSEMFPACNIVERSDTAARGLEGLDDIPSITRVQRSEDFSDGVVFEQNGLKLIAYARSGQKTGFYLDQRVLRQEIRQLAANRRVLNLFSYTGSHGVAAAAGGATSVHHVDSSADALSKIADHWKLNGLTTPVTVESDDIFQWLGRLHTESYEMVILDPPALIKSQKDQEAGQRAYHFLNRAAMRLVAQDGLLITSSCSQFFSEQDLLTTVRRASLQNNRECHLLKVTHQGADHPRSLYFPEGHYLTSLICQLS